MHEIIKNNMQNMCKPMTYLLTLNHIKINKINILIPRSINIEIENLSRFIPQNLEPWQGG